jgi:para-nitrobenzyl esterase
MKTHTLTVPAVFAAVFAAAMPALAQAPEVVKIDSGRVRGAVKDGVLSFKGIPFAAPPVGQNRWRAPQPVKPWPGVRAATQYGPDPMQKPVPGDAAPPGVAPAEDCLYLNVWRPAAAKPGEKLPVMVWVYGGGYVNGGASTPIYDGSAFARQGIVFVSFNYRLGRFGFFAHPALLAAKEGPVGNFALMDQIAALQWVKRNAAAFGGDPDRVTVFGESAGGDSVVHLITSPAAAGLFRRAAVLSGGGRRHLLGGLPLTGGTRGAPSADTLGVNFARLNGVWGTDQAALKRLRALPARKVVGGLNMLSYLAPVGPLTFSRGPITDGVIVTAPPADVFRQGKAAKVPLLIGTTTADLPVTLPPSKRDPWSYFGPGDAAKARALYDPTGTAKASDVRFALGADITMQEPARFAARQAAAAGQPVWLYRFGYVATSQRAKSAGAGHASELPFVFDTVAARYGKDATAADRAAAKAANRYFANYAKYGDPNGPGLPKWPRYDLSRPDLMLFTVESGPVVKPDPWKARLDLVERAADAGRRVLVK